MKSISLSCCALLLTLTISAQHETIFNNVRVVGGFATPLVEFGIGNDLSTSVGGGAGIVINHCFIGGYGLANIDLQELIENGDVDEIDIAHGGFWIGGTVGPYKLLHVYGSARIGWGAVNIEGSDPFDDIYDAVFVTTPEIGAELNIARWLRLYGAVGYRWVNGVDETRGYDKNAFDGAVGTIGLRLGWFGHR